MAFVDEETAVKLAAGTARVSAGLLVKTDDGEDPPNWVRLWTGVGPLEIAADLIDTQGGVFAGAGEVVGFPAISQLVNGLAERVEFSLSGVSAQVWALADAEAATVRDAPVHVCLLPMDADFQPLCPPLWCWEGSADVTRISRKSAAGGIIRTVAISVGSIMTGRRRTSLSNWTGVDQRRRSADDAFCDRAGIYNAGTTRKWP